MRPLQRTGHLRLTQKHQRQSTNSENAPPTIGPRPQARPQTTPRMPKYLLRSLSGNVSSHIGLIVTEL